MDDRSVYLKGHQAMRIPLKKLTSRGVLTLSLVCVSLAFILLAYAVSRDAEIIRSKDGLIRIIPNGKDRIKQLEGLLSESVTRDQYKRLQADYKRLEKDLQIARGQVNRLLRAAGADLSEGEDVAVRKIMMLAGRSRKAERDMSVSLAVIRREVALGGTINTNSRAKNGLDPGLFMEIQKLLRCIGAYNGEIDGDQAATCRAVRQFQKKSSLKDDGIIGKKTLEVLEKAFEAAKSH